MYSFKNKNVLITGSARGIGKAIAKAFAENDANVIINYVSSEKQALLLSDEINKSGKNSIVLQGDVSNFEESKALIDKAIETYGKIDILINNSGITRDNLMLRMSESDFDRVISVNLKGTWNMCKNITRHF